MLFLKKKSQTNAVQRSLHMELSGDRLSRLCVKLKMYIGCEQT